MFAIRWCVYPALVIPQDKEGMPLRPNQWKLVPPVAHGSNPEMIDAFRGRIVRLETTHGLLPNQPFRSPVSLNKRYKDGCLLTIQVTTPSYRLKTPKGDDKRWRRGG